MESSSDEEKRALLAEAEAVADTYTDGGMDKKSALVYIGVMKKVGVCVCVGVVCVCGGWVFWCVISRCICYSET